MLVKGANGVFGRCSMTSCSDNTINVHRCLERHRTIELQLPVECETYSRDEWSPVHLRDIFHHKSITLDVTKMSSRLSFPLVNRFFKTSPMMCSFS